MYFHNTYISCKNPSGLLLHIYALRFNFNCFDARCKEVSVIFFFFIAIFVCKEFYMIISRSCCASEFSESLLKLLALSVKMNIERYCS